MRFAAILLSLIFLLPARGDDRLSSRIDARVRQYADAGLFAGVVLVARGDEVIYRKAFGRADHTFAVDNTTTTRFHIASLSKPVTAAAVLLLAQRGKLSLDWPVAKVLPDFPNGERITIEQLLTHYSGLDDTSAKAEYAQWSRMPHTPAMLVERLAKLPPRGEPGKEYAYNNANYHLLARIIEKVSGQSYGEFLREHIFRPLAMNDTAHRGDEKEIIPRLANGYMPKGASGVERPDPLDWSTKTGNGSLISTVDDLLRFHRALQRGTLLAGAVVEASYNFGRADRDVGMFWFRGNRAGHRSVYINGSSPGFKAHMERFIDDDAVIIILSNLYLASPTPMARDIGALMWEADAKLAAVPAPVKRSAAELDRFIGTYQFGAEFYVPNQLARVERRDGYLEMTYTIGDRVVPLLPSADGSFFDRQFWSTVRFEEGKLIYRNGNAEFIAAKVTAPQSRPF